MLLKQVIVLNFKLLNEKEIGAGHTPVNCISFLIKAHSLRQALMNCTVALVM